MQRLTGAHVEHAAAHESAAEGRSGQLAPLSKSAAQGWPGRAACSPLRRPSRCLHTHACVHPSTPPSIYPSSMTKLLMD
eukprot:357182-Chlamydomonas_euryale.AAC.4